MWRMHICVTIEKLCITVWLQWLEDRSAHAMPSIGQTLVDSRMIISCMYIHRIQSPGIHSNIHTKSVSGIRACISINDSSVSL